MAERFWLRETATNRLTGELTESNPPPVVPGYEWVLESDIRALHPSGPIAPGAIYNSVSYTAPSPPTLTNIEQIRAGAKREARRILRWQEEVRRDYSRVHAAALVTKVQDLLLFAHHGLNRTLRSTAHSDAVRIGFLRGWELGPANGETVPEFFVAAVSVNTPTAAYVWAHTVSISPLELGGQQPTNLQYASVPTPADLQRGRWVDSLVSNG